MATDLADYSQAVQVLGGSVTITGTASVSIVGTPTVNIGNSPTVSISGTVNVAITSGTVNIGNTPSINILSQSVTVNVNQPMSALTDITWTVDATKTTDAVPTGTHALLLILAVGAPQTGSVTITGHTTGAIYFPNDNRVTSGFAYTGDFIIVLVDSAHDSKFDIQILGVASNPTTLKVAAILDTAAVNVSTRPTDPLYITTPQGVPAATKGIGVAAAAGNNQFATPTFVQPYDVTGVSAPAVSTQASVVLAATPGKTYTAAAVIASLSQSTGAGLSVYVQLLDGAAVLLKQIMAVSATVGDKDHLAPSGLGYKGTTGNSMTFQCATLLTGVFESVSIGAYLA